MRYRSLICGTALVAAQIAVAQSGMSSSCDVNSCRATFTFGPAGLPNSASAAYSGQETTEMFKKLPDGTSIIVASSSFRVIYRDSQARIRVEHRIAPPLRGVRRTLEVPWVEIQDPLAGYLYVLDPVHQIAHRVKVDPRKPTVRPAFVYDTPPSTGTGTTVSLGTKFMFGVMLTGWQTTLAPRMINGESITNVEEVWTDPQTNVIVLRKGTSRHGEYRKTMKNYSNAEPDPALFMVPSGYTVVDESGPFTIVVSRARN